MAQFRNAPGLGHGFQRIAADGKLLRPVGGHFVLPPADPQEAIETRFPFPGPEPFSFP